MKRTVLLTLALLLSACQPAAASPTPNPTNPAPLTAAPGASPSIAPATESPTPPPSPTPQPTSPPASPTPTATAPPVFPFAAPIPIEGNRLIDESYRFGTTQGGVRETHYGVEFANPFGSPVIAAADGVVLFSGNDNNGGPYTPPGWYAFYGNFVIIEHQISLPQGDAQTIYTLYAHMSKLLVETGQTIRAGDILGEVGFSGAAEGPHLHLEIRTDGTAYKNSRNPELFLQPQPGTGTLLISIKDPNGSPLQISGIQLTPIHTASYTRYLTTYEETNLLNQPPYYESLGLSNLPAGTYELTFIAYTLETYTIEIRDGELTRIDIIVKE